MKKKADSSNSHTHPYHSVSDKTINQQVDALFADPNAEQNYSNLWKTFQQIFKHGLDYRQGNPLKQVAKHLKDKLEEYNEKYEAENGHDIWGCSSGKKKKM